MSSMTGAGGMRPTGGYKLPKISGYQNAQVPNFSPEQMQLFQSLLGGLQPGLGKGLEHLGGLASGDQSQFEQLEAPAMRQFSELQGNLASRFSGAGMGARRSSGFGLASNANAQGLAEQLQSQRLGLQNNAISQLMGLSQNLLGQRPYENLYMPKKKSMWQELLLGLSGGLGQAGGSLAGMYGANKFGLMG